MKALARHTAGAALLAAGLFISEMVPFAFQQPPATPQPVAPAPAEPGRAGAAPAGRGGGRGNPAAGMYTERCAACHGTIEAAGRAPSLFDDQWTRAKDDEGIAAVIADGVPQTEMIPFKALLTDQQIWQLVAYLRTQAANAKPRPTYVPDPDGQEIKTEKQTFKIEVVAREIETPWGLAFLPDGRLLVTERAGKLRIIPKDKSGAVVTVTGTPKVWERQDGGHVRRRGASAVREERLDLPLVRRAGPELHAASAAGRGGRARGAGTRPRRPWSADAGHSVDDDDRPRQDRQGQRVDRSAGDLPRAGRAVHRQQHALRLALHLRSRRGTCSTRSASAASWRTRRTWRSPLGKVHRVNDDGSVPKDNPFVNRAGALPTIWSYGHRNPQGLAWDPVRQAVGVGARAPGRRRDQHHRAGQELRLGRDHDGRPAGHHQAQRAGDGAADRLLHADDRAERHDVLHRQPVSGLEEQSVRERARRTAAAAARDHRTARSPPRKCCSTSSAASTTSSRGRTACST